MRCSQKVVATVLLLALVMSLVACSIPGRKPEGGIWYCEELMIEIDFDAYQTNLDQHCAKKYNPDGTYQDVLCQFDYGTIIHICSEDQEETYLTANFLYKNGVFRVTTVQDKITYIFERIDTAD